MATLQMNPTIESKLMDFVLKRKRLDVHFVFRLNYQFCQRLLDLENMKPQKVEINVMEA